MNRLGAVVAGALLIPAAAIVAVSTNTAAAADRRPPAGPHIVQEADHLSGRVLAKGKTGASVPVVSASDGCDRNYGLPRQCIPLSAPNNGPVTCWFLRREGFLDQPLVVHYDHLHLVSHGVVCPA